MLFQIVYEITLPIDYQYYISALMGEFCYWQAKSLEDCIFVYINIIATITIAVFTVKYFLKTDAQLRRRVRTIYIGIALWILTNLAKDTYSVIVYHLFITNGNFTSNYSKIFAIIDTPPAIIVQTLFLAIPYMMWKNVSRILDRMKIQRTIEEQQFLNFFTFYLTIRFVILVLPWVALIIIPTRDSSGANFVKLAMQLIDSLICNILLIGSLKSFLERFGQIKLDSQQDRKKLKWEYALMVVCSSFRFFIDLCFLIILPLYSDSDCISPIQYHYYFSIGYTFFGGILMHFVPICIILYIYRPNQSKGNANESVSNA